MQQENKLEKLKSILELIQNDTITPSTLKQFITIVLSVIKDGKDSNEKVSKELADTVNQAISYLDKEHTKLTTRIDTELSKAEKKIQDNLSKTLSLLEDVKKIEVKDGIDGKDADEDLIVDKVLSKIEIPEYKEIELDNGEKIVYKINELSTTPENQIDAKHIKNLPKMVQSFVGGSAGNIKEIIAGTNVTIDNTNSGYPVISVTGGSGSGVVETVAAGTGISVDSTDPANPIVTNDAPDQTVTITGAGSTTVTGTYPNFTVSSTGGSGGGIPGGLDTQVQFNDNGSFNGTNLTYDKLTSVFTSDFQLGSQKLLTTGDIGSSSSRVSTGYFKDVNIASNGELRFVALGSQQMTAQSQSIKWYDTNNYAGISITAESNINDGIDKTITLPNKTGTVALLSDISSSGADVHLSNLNTTAINADLIFAPVAPRNIKIADTTVLDDPGYDLTVTAGTGNGSGTGGYLNLYAGAGGSTGDGGSFFMTAGSGGVTSGNGGSLNFLGGNGQANGTNGGDVIFTPGSKMGAGTEGLIKFINPTSGNYAILDTSILSSVNTFTLPDKSGTIALTSDITSGGDVSGGVSSTDNAITRYDGSTGKIIQNSTVTLEDDGRINGANAIVLDTTPNTITPTVGQLYWDTTENTLAVNLDIVNGVTLSIGTEQYLRVVNKTGSTISDGKAVYINGAQGNRPTIALAKADAISTSMLIGIATQNIADNDEGFITISGDVHGFNTSGFTAGDILYLSATTAGELTKTAPTSPNNVVLVATACNSTNNGQITVNLQKPLSADTALSGNSDLIAPTQKAVKTYADTKWSDSSTNTGTNKTLNSNTNYIDADATHSKVFLNLGRAGVVGDAVYVTAWNVANSCPEVSLARANSITTLPCAGVLESAGADGTVQSMRIEGNLIGVNTSTWSTGTRLYVSAATAGTLTSTRPTTPNFDQAVATVVFQDATNGVLDCIRTAYVGTMAYADTASYVASNVAITGATKTKITYDAKGLVTSGADATTADIADSTNKRYVTDANLTVIGNTSGTNSGDNAANTTSNTYADGKVADAINDGTTTIAPSQNAVFDALALKAPLTSPTFATSINGSYLTASQILGTDASKNIVSLPVATYPSLTELSYVKGVTSAIQTQLGGKASTAAASTSAAGLAPQATAPGAGLYNYLGITNGETAYSNKALFDTTVPSTQALGDSASTGTATVAARRDHKHAMPANPVSGTINEIAYLATASTVGSLAVATYPSLVELAYVKGATSSIQTQLTARLPLAGGTMTGNITLGENTSISLDPAGSADGKYSGITVTGVSGYSQSFGDLVYLDPTDSRWEATDANSASAADGDARGTLGMVVSAGTDGNACTILLHGIIRADAKFPTMTINAPMYVSETAGSITETQPTTTDVVIRIIGSALTADELYFNPDRIWITHT